MVHSNPWELVSPDEPLELLKRRSAVIQPKPAADAPPVAGSPVGSVVEPAPAALREIHETTGAEARAVVFNRLLGELSATFELLDGDAFRSLGAHLDRHAKVGPTARRETHEWLACSRPNFSGLVTRQEMHWIFYHTYFWACLEMGPVETDRHFARALRVAGAHPEADRHRPQSFL